jgi:hypothetical protein
VIVTVSPPSPIVIVDPEFFLIVFTFISDVIKEQLLELLHLLRLVDQLKHTTYNYHH